MVRTLSLVALTLTLACASSRPSTPSATLESGGARGMTDAEREQFETLTWAADFREAQDRYTAAVRWGLADDAAAFVDPELRSAFRSLARRELREVRLTDYAVDELHLEPRATVARAEVRYEGFWLASPFVRWVDVSQDWHHDGEARRWFVRPDIEKLRSAAVKAAP